MYGLSVRKCHVYSGFIDKLTAGNMPYPNSALPKSSQLRLCNYSAASMGWNAKFVMVRLLTIMFMLLGLNKNSIIFYTESKCLCEDRTTSKCLNRRELGTNAFVVL